MQRCEYIVRPPVDGWWLVVLVVYSVQSHWADVHIGLEKVVCIAFHIHQLRTALIGFTCNAKTTVIHWSYDHESLLDPINIALHNSQYTIDYVYNLTSIKDTWQGIYLLISLVLGYNHVLILHIIFYIKYSIMPKQSVLLCIAPK